MTLTVQQTCVAHGTLPDEYLLAEIEEGELLVVRLVVLKGHDGKVTPLMPRSAWEGSLQARLIDSRQATERLHARRLELERAIEERSHQEDNPPPTLPATGECAEHARATQPLVAPAPAADYPLEAKRAAARLVVTSPGQERARPAQAAQPLVAPAPAAARRPAAKRAPARPVVEPADVPSVQDALEYDLDLPDVLTSEWVDDPLQAYLHQIGQISLLTVEEEQSLGERMAAGLAAQTAFEQGERGRAIERAIADAQAAREHMINANLRLVVSIAKKYLGRGLAFFDLIQEGNIGLMRAVEKFDHTLGHKFSTYATWWIRQAISRSLADDSRTVRLPVHVNDDLIRIRRAAYHLHQRMERAPTVQEVAAAVGMSERKVSRLLIAGQQPTSLDAPVAETNDAASLGDLIADHTLPDPVEAAAESDLSAILREVVARLDERSRRVIELRYGLDNGQHRTLEEVAGHFGLTRERIRQIEADALRQLRHPHLRKRLSGLI